MAFWSITLAHGDTSVPPTVLTMKPGDVLIIRGLTGPSPTSHLTDWLEKWLPDTPVLMFSGSADLETVPEETMNRLGWYRK